MQDKTSSSAFSGEPFFQEGAGKEAASSPLFRGSRVYFSPVLRGMFSPGSGDSVDVCGCVDSTENLSGSSTTYAAVSKRLAADEDSGLLSTVSEGISYFLESSLLLRRHRIDASRQRCDIKRTHYQKKQGHLLNAWG